MSAPQTPLTPESAARAEASLWIVRLHGPQRSPELEAGFRQWLAADPQHAAEFERVTEVWDAASGLTNSGLPRVARWQPAASLRPLARAAIVVVICGVLAMSAYWLWRAPSTYETAIGEQRTVRAEDGTRICLNSGTRVRIAYRDSERRVQLEQGEAFFEVAHDGTRPFVVNAGDREVKALGTAFVVRYEADRMAVTLLEGKVSVTRTAAQSAAAARTLEPGERLVVDPGRPAQLDKPRIEVVTAWRRGEVILDRTTLADAVAEMNRYDRTALVIDSHDIGQMRVSGVYKTGDSVSFARTAAKMLGLQITEREGRIHLQRAPEEPPALQ